MKIKNNLHIHKDIGTHPLLTSTMLIHSKMESLFPNNFDELIPQLNEFVKTGLVPESLMDFFSYQKSNYSTNNFYLHHIRSDFIKNYGFSLLSEPLIEVLVNQFTGKKILEIGAGTGFLAKKILDKEINIVALDYQSNSESVYSFNIKHTEVLHADGIQYLKNSTKPKFDAIILSWPDYGSNMATKVLEQLKPGQKLYYQGESYGGCTADDSFFNLLETKASLNEELSTELQEHGLIWPGLHDQWYVYDIKE